MILMLAALAGCGAIALFLWRHPRIVWWHLGHSTTRNGKVIYHTNATWSEDATKVLHPTGHAHSWYWIRRRRRAGILIGSEAAAVLTVYGLITARRLTVTLLAAAVLAAAGWYVRRAVRWACTWNHLRHHVTPVRKSLTAARLRPDTVEVERDGQTVKSVTVTWPPEFELIADDQQKALSVVTSRLAIEAPVAAWKLKGRERSVTLTQSDPPPGLVAWEGQIAAAVERAGPAELVFGLGKRESKDRPYPVVKASYSESPHLIIAGGSGGGKSGLAAFLMLQELHRGSLIFNLDPKWISHLWLQDLPNVINAHETLRLHMALEWLGKELHRRTEAAYYSAGGTGRIRGTFGPRIIAVCEELNYGMPALKDHWREVRTKEDPKRSPALTGLAALSCAGRAADMHEWLMAQMLTVESTGVKDSTVRGNAGIKAMVRWELPGWVAACGKHVPMPEPPTTPGRLSVVTAGGVRETQGPWLHLDDEDEEVAEKAVRWAREYAVSGTVAQIPTGRDGIPRELWPPSVLGRDPLGISAGQGCPESPRTPPGSPPPDLITLRRACADGTLPCSLDAARKAAQRPGFPEVRGWDGPAALYAAADLRAFQESKVRVLR